MSRVLSNKVSHYFGGQDVFADARPDELLTRTAKGQWAAFFGATALEQANAQPFVSMLGDLSARLTGYMSAGCGEGGE